jgi:hypothetical protein
VGRHRLGDRQRHAWMFVARMRGLIKSLCGSAATQVLKRLAARIAGMVRAMLHYVSHRWIQVATCDFYIWINAAQF